VHSDTGSLCIKNWDSNIYYCEKNHGTAAGKVGKFESYTNGVWCKAFTVENLKGKKYVDFLR